MYGCWWAVARAKWQSYGGELASITNEELNDELTGKDSADSAALRHIGQGGGLFAGKCF